MSVFNNAINSTLPLVQVSFKLEGKDIEIGDKYTCTYSRNGIVKLQINGFTAADVGTYECFAKNDYGEMNQPVIAIMAQYPGESWVDT